MGVFFSVFFFSFSHFFCLFPFYFHFFSEFDFIVKKVFLICDSSFSFSFFPFAFFCFSKTFLSD